MQIYVKNIQDVILYTKKLYLAQKNKMNKEKKELNLLLKEVLEQNNGSKNTRSLLNEIVVQIAKSPLLLWDDDEIKELAVVALRVLFLDVIESEEDEILWANKTFAYITQSLLKAREKNATAAELFGILKNRVLLLHSHDDFFIDILSYFFFHNAPVEKESEQFERRAFLLRKIAAMQFCDLKTLEKYYKDLQNDSYLIEVEQNVLGKYEFTEEEIVEAQLLLDALFKYIWHQL